MRVHSLYSFVNFEIKTFTKLNWIWVKLSFDNISVLPLNYLDCRYFRLNKSFNFHIQRKLHVCFFHFVYLNIFLLLLLSFHLFFAQGLSETTFLPSQGRGKVCVHSTLPRPHLWDYTRDDVVVVYKEIISGISFSFLSFGFWLCIYCSFFAIPSWLPSLKRYCNLWCLEDTLINRQS